MDDGDVTGIAAVEATGNPINVLSDEVTAEMKATGDAQIAKWIEEATALGLDGQSLVDQATAMIDKYSPKTN